MHRTPTPRRLLAVAAVGLTAGAAAACAIPCGASCGPSEAPAPDWAVSTSAEPLTTIAFGSCNDQDRPQPLWQPILANRPDLWIWLGDNIYADTEDMAEMRRMYERQLANPGYRTLLERTPVVGIWDDHDYGANNAGKEYPRKTESQQLLLDFLGVPEDSPRRSRAGAYGAYTYGPEGRQVKVILLDTRYHRDPVGPDGDVLGEAQWAWLERELRNSTAQLHVIASSIQVIPEDHRFEKWANFPKARERLFRLIGETGAPGVVFLSGDRHMAEISRVTGTAAGYPLYEVTSSGMTHTWRDGWREEYNRHRVGRMLVALNFGTLLIDWGEDPVLTLQVRDRENRVRLEERVPLRHLRPEAARAAAGR